MFSWILLIVIEAGGISALADAPLLPIWLIWIFVLIIPFIILLLLYLKYKGKISEFNVKRLESKKLKNDIELQEIEKKIEKDKDNEK